jgi:hypothetical protein
MELDANTLAGLRKLLADAEAAEAAAAGAKDAPAEPDWGLGGILHLILDHTHVREDLREKAHTAVDALAEAAGEVADTVDAEAKTPEGA